MIIIISTVGMCVVIVSASVVVVLACWFRASIVGAIIVIAPRAGMPIVATLGLLVLCVILSYPLKSRSSALAHLHMIPAWFHGHSSSVGAWLCLFASSFSSMSLNCALAFSCSLFVFSSNVALVCSSSNRYFTCAMRSISSHVVESSVSMVSLPSACASVISCIYFFLWFIILVPFGVADLLLFVFLSFGFVRLVMLVCLLRSYSFIAMVMAITAVAVITAIMRIVHVVCKYVDIISVPVDIPLTCW